VSVIWYATDADLGLTVTHEGPVGASGPASPPPEPPLDPLLLPPPDPLELPPLPLPDPPLLPPLDPLLGPPLDPLLAPLLLPVDPPLLLDPLLPMGALDDFSGSPESAAQAIPRQAAAVTTAKTPATSR
jgi:hypothetical protein